MQEDYEKFEKWITRSWLKTIWEKAHKFGLEITLGNIPLEFAREGDKWMMRAFMEAGYNGTELERLNRVRVHQ